MLFLENYKVKTKINWIDKDKIMSKILKFLRLENVNWSYHPYDLTKQYLKFRINEIRWIIYRNKNIICIKFDRLWSSIDYKMTNKDIKLFTKINKYINSINRENI